MVKIGQQGSAPCRCFLAGGFFVGACRFAVQRRRALVDFDFFQD